MRSHAVQSGWAPILIRTITFISWPTVPLLFTINSIRLFAGLIFCGMNCCSPCACQRQEDREMSSITSQARAEVDQEAPPVTSKVKTTARILGGMALTGVQVGMSIWALKWIGPYSQASPLNYVGNLIVDAALNCTT